MIFDINGLVDLGSKEVPHSIEELKFSKKNSLPFNELLSNYKSINSNGWTTTNGETISLESFENNKAVFSHRNRLYTINNVNKILKSVTSIALPYSEEIRQFYVGTDIYIRTDYHIFKYNNGNYDIFFEIPLDVDNEPHRCFFSTNKTGIFWCNNNFYDLDLNVVATSDIVFRNQQGIKIKEEPNNGYYDFEYWILGYDSDDHSKDWCQNNRGESLDFIGHITSTGDAIGEPRPDNLTPQILSNRMIKWNRFADINGLKTQNINNLASGAEPDITDSPDSFGQNWNPPAYIPYTFIYGMNKSGQHLKIDEWNQPNSWLMIDTLTSPGVYWDATIDAFTSIFPNASLFTNDISTRGKLYDYEGDWFSCFYNFRLWTKISNVVSIHSTPLMLFVYDKGYITRDIEVDNTNAIGLKKGNGKLNGWVLPTPDDDDRYHIIDSTYWIDDSTICNKKLKHHLFTKAQAQANNWSQWRNTADFRIDQWPRNVDIGDDYKVHYYNGLPICISRNNVAITTPTTEMSNVWDFNGDILVANNEIYIFEDATIENIEISKISDYKFKINIVNQVNIINENRDGSISLASTFIPYFNEVYWSGWGSLALLQCPDGNDYNDNFIIAAGINATLDDNIVETSALLPAINIPLYCNSRDIDAFNRNILDKNAPIIVPDTKCIPKNVALDCYFTHSLYSTNIDYRFSFKNGIIFNNEKMLNTLWWIGANTIFLPLGLASIFSGINYLASTVMLPGNYSVRLYTQNNNSFLLYNITQQSYYGQTIFTIYGSSYYYDGQGIYYVGDGSQNEFVCYAIGMKFLSNSGTEAYFYSPVDKYLYTFTGSNTLTKALPLSDAPYIKDALFSSVDQTLYILFEDSSLFAQNGISSALFKDFENIDHLEGTVKGCALISDKKYNILNAINGDLLPLEVETEYIGADDYLWNLKYVDFMLYDNDCKITVEIEIKMLGTIEQGETTKLVIGKNDFKNKYYKIRIAPKVNKGQAFKIKFYSKDPVSIQSISPYVERVSETGFKK